MSRFRWAPYVPVAQRREEAQEKIRRLKKQGKKIQPITITGRSIAYSFWGKAWCDHIQSFSDYSNRLPRGRSYVKNGAVVHLEIRKGEIFAKVSGTRLYTVLISIKTLSPKKWKDVKTRCSGQIGSIIELLQGKLSKNVMAVVTDRQNGLFPQAKEITLDCTCPDWAVMCKHVAAVMYGVGARLDENPELLFLLRGVDHEELIEAQADFIKGAGKGKTGRKRIAGDAVADVFGIEVSGEIEPPGPGSKRVRKQGAQPVQGPKPDPGGAGKGAQAKSLGDAPGKAGLRKKARPAPGDPSNQERSLLAAFRQAMESRASGQGGKKKQAPDNPTGKEIYEFRMRLGMTQAQLACLFGVTPAAVSHWEKKSESPALHSGKLPVWDVIKGLRGPKR